MSFSSDAKKEMCKIQGTSMAELYAECYGFCCFVKNLQKRV